MTERKNTDYRRIIYLSIFALLAIVLIVIELFKIEFSADKTVHDLIYGVITRFIGSVICILMILYCSLGNIFSLKKKTDLKKIALIIPCWLVAINNFPFIAVFDGTASLDTEWYLVLLLAIECFLVGFFEECAFRGCVFLLVLEGRYKTRKGIFTSIVISSIIFGAVHIVNIFAGAGFGAVMRQLGYSALIGAMCSVVLLITHEIWSCIFLHAVFNFAGAWVPTLGSGAIWNVPTVIITAVLALIVTAYTVILFLKMDISKTEDLFALKKSRLQDSEEQSNG